MKYILNAGLIKLTTDKTDLDTKSVFETTALCVERSVYILKKWVEFWAKKLHLIETPEGAQVTTTCLGSLDSIQKIAETSKNEFRTFADEHLAEAANEIADEMEKKVIEQKEN